ncbi:MAG: hypothetical protein ACLR0N_01585 [Bilophila wadsworthia]
MAVKQLPKISDLPEPPDRLVGDQERFDVLTFNSLKAQKKMVNDDLNKTLIPALNEFAVDVNASVDAAALSERNAHDSEEVAKRKAGEASGSAGAAKVSEDTAKVSETNALASKNAAALSAESAESARIAAEAARDEAQDLANVGYASESRAGLAKVDGKTTQAAADGAITVKDVAIGGDLEDLASARGQVGNAALVPPHDYSTGMLSDKTGQYRSAYLGSSNAPFIGPYSEIITGVPNYRASLLLSSGRSEIVRAAISSYINETARPNLFSGYNRLITEEQIGDGIISNNGILSVPEYEGATASAAGTSGLVPPATAGQQESFLTGGGEYKPALTKISDSVNLADSKTAASAKAVKAAYDRGTDGVTAANGKLSLSGGVMSGRIGGLRGNYNADASSRYVTGALEIRENGGVGNAQSDIAYAPTIGFHWANRVAGLLALRSDGIFSFMKQNGTRAVVDCDVPYATAANKLRREGGVDTSWYWNGQGGQPGWLWGGNDGVNMYVYNPANFSVNYANSAGGARTVSINYAAYNDFPLNANFTMPFDGLAVIFVTGSGWGHIKLFVNVAEVSRARMYGEDSANPCDSPSAFVRSGIVVQGQVNGSRISGVVRCFPGA